MTHGAAQRVAVADIGGTHARFAIAEYTGQVVRIHDLTVLGTPDFPTFDEAWRAFAERADLAGIGEVAVSFAGPVRTAPFRLTNGEWALDPDELARSLDIQRVTVVNDLAAIARAIPALPGHSFYRICGPLSDRPGGPVTSVVGLGTGLGLALLLDDGQPTVKASEGGHIGYAPQSDADTRVLAHLKSRYGRVSVERVVSGNALRDLIETLGGKVDGNRTDSELWTEAIEGAHTVASEAVDMMLANLGSAAGDFALAQGSQSVVLAGGLMSRLQSRLLSSAFADCFYAKGRLSDYVADIPVFLLDNKSAGLIGAALSVPNQ